MELGVSKFFWELSYNHHSPYVTQTWTTHIWEYLSHCGVKLVDNAQWNYVPPQCNDFHVMDVILQSELSEFHKSVFNQIRIYLHVITAGDLFDNETKRLRHDLYTCRDL